MELKRGLCAGDCAESLSLDCLDYGNSRGCFPILKLQLDYALPCQSTDMLHRIISRRFFHRNKSTKKEGGDLAPQVLLRPDFRFKLRAHAVDDGAVKHGMIFMDHTQYRW